MVSSIKKVKISMDSYDKNIILPSLIYSYAYCIMMVIAIAYPSFYAAFVTYDLALWGAITIHALVVAGLLVSFFRQISAAAIMFSVVLCYFRLKKWAKTKRGKDARKWLEEIGLRKARVCYNVDCALKTPSSVKIQLLIDNVSTR